MLEYVDVINAAINTGMNVTNCNLNMFLWVLLLFIWLASQKSWACTINWEYLFPLFVLLHQVARKHDLYFISFFKPYILSFSKGVFNAQPFMSLLDEMCNITHRVTADIIWSANFGKKQTWKIIKTHLKFKKIT